MKIAIWIIAMCEVVRVAQNLIQIMYIKQDTGARDNAYAEFVKSLKSSDREFVKRILEEFDEVKTDEEEYEDYTERDTIMMGR